MVGVQLVVMVKVDHMENQESIKPLSKTFKERVLMGITLCIHSLKGTEVIMCTTTPRN